jgi:hypothetical protein
MHPVAHHRVSKNPPLDHNPRQIDPVHAPHPISWRYILISYHLHLCLPSSLFPSGLQTTTCKYLSPPQYVSHTPSLSDHHNNSQWAVQTTKFTVSCLLHSPVTTSLSSRNIFLSTQFSNILSHCSYFIVLLLCYPNWGFSVLFSSVVRQMPGYNSQRRGTARTSQFSFLCIMCIVCVYMCDVLLPPGVNPTAVIYRNPLKLCTW